MSYWDLGNIGLGQTVRQGDALGGMFPAPETSSTSSLKEELDALASRGLDAAPTPTLGDLDAFKADLNASLKDYYATRLAEEAPDRELLESIGAVTPEKYTSTWDWWKARMQDPNSDTTTRFYDTTGTLAREAAMRLAQATGRPEQETFMAQMVDLAVRNNTNIPDEGLYHVPEWWTKAVQETVGKTPLVGGFLAGILAPEVLPDITSPLKFGKNYGIPVLAGMAGGVVDAVLDPLEMFHVGPNRAGRIVQDIAKESPEVVKGMGGIAKSPIQDFVQRYPYLDEQGIRDTAAPLLMNRRGRQAEEELNATRAEASLQLYMAQRQNDFAAVEAATKTLQDLDAREAAFAEVNRAAYGDRMEEFNRMLEAARKDPSTQKVNPIRIPWFSKAEPTEVDVLRHILPEEMFDPNLPVDSRMESLARARAALEHQAIQGLPAVRFLDMRIAPSPFHWAWRKVEDALRGQYNEVGTILRRAAEVNTPGETLINADYLVDEDKPGSQPPAGPQPPGGGPAPVSPAGPVVAGPTPPSGAAPAGGPVAGPTPVPPTPGAPPAPKVRVAKARGVESDGVSEWATRIPGAQDATSYHPMLGDAVRLADVVEYGVANPGNLVGQLDRILGTIDLEKAKVEGGAKSVNDLRRFRDKVAAGKIAEAVSEKAINGYTPAAINAIKKAIIDAWDADVEIAHGLGSEFLDSLPATADLQALSEPLNSLFDIARVSPKKFSLLPKAEVDNVRSTLHERLVASDWGLQSLPNRPIRLPSYEAILGRLEREVQNVPGGLDMVEHIRQNMAEYHRDANRTRIATVPATTPASTTPAPVAAAANPLAPAGPPPTGGAPAGSTPAGPPPTGGSPEGGAPGGGVTGTGGAPTGSSRKPVAESAPKINPAYLAKGPLPRDITAAGIITNLDKRSGLRVGERGAGKNLRAWVNNLVQAVQTSGMPMSRTQLEAYINVQIAHAQAAHFRRRIDSPDDYFRVSFEGSNARTGATGARGEFSARPVSMDGKEMAYVIRLFNSSDFSTLIHESTHYLETFLSPAERLTVESWAKKQGSDAWAQSKGYSSEVGVREFFALGLEKYIRDGGVSASWAKPVQQIFEKIKDFLVALYTSMGGAGKAYWEQFGPLEISDDIRTVFDNYMDVDAARSYHLGIPDEGLPTRPTRAEASPVVKKVSEAYAEHVPIRSKGVALATQEEASKLLDSTGPRDIQVMSPDDLYHLHEAASNLGVEATSLDELIYDEAADYIANFKNGTSVEYENKLRSLFGLEKLETKRYSPEDRLSVDKIKELLREVPLSRLSDVLTKTDATAYINRLRAHLQETMFPSLDEADKATLMDRSGRLQYRPMWKSTTDDLANLPAENRKQFLTKALGDMPEDLVAEMQQAFDIDTLKPTDLLDDKFAQRALEKGYRRLFGEDPVAVLDMVDLDGNTISKKEALLIDLVQRLDTVRAARAGEINGAPDTWGIDDISHSQRVERDVRGSGDLGRKLGITVDDFSKAAGKDTHLILWKSGKTAAGDMGPEPYKVKVVSVKTRGGAGAAIKDYTFKYEASPKKWISTTEDTATLKKRLEVSESAYRAAMDAQVQERTAKLRKIVGGETPESGNSVSDYGYNNNVEDYSSRIPVSVIEEGEYASKYAVGAYTPEQLADGLGDGMTKYGSKGFKALMLRAKDNPTALNALNISNGSGWSKGVMSNVPGKNRVVRVRAYGEVGANGVAELLDEFYGTLLGGAKVSKRDGSPEVVHLILQDDAKSPVYDIPMGTGDGEVARWEISYVANTEKDVPELKEDLAGYFSGDTLFSKADEVPNLAPDETWSEGLTVAQKLSTDPDDLAFLDHMASPDYAFALSTEERARVAQEIYWDNDEQPTAVALMSDGNILAKISGEDSAGGEYTVYALGRSKKDSSVVDVVRTDVEEAASEEASSVPSEETTAPEEEVATPEETPTPEEEAAPSGDSTTPEEEVAPSEKTATPAEEAAPSGDRPTSGEGRVPPLAREIDYAPHAAALAGKDDDLVGKLIRSGKMPGVDTTKYNANLVATFAALPATERNSIAKIIVESHGGTLGDYAPKGVSPNLYPLLDKLAAALLLPARDSGTASASKRIQGMFKEIVTKEATANLKKESQGSAGASEEAIAKNTEAKMEALRKAAQRDAAVKANLWTAKPLVTKWMAETSSGKAWLDKSGWMAKAKEAVSPSAPPPSTVPVAYRGDVPFRATHWDPRAREWAEVHKAGEGKLLVTYSSGGVKTIDEAALGSTMVPIWGEESITPLSSSYYTEEEYKAVLPAMSASSSIPFLAELYLLKNSPSTLGEARNVARGKGLLAEALHPAQHLHLALHSAAQDILPESPALKDLLRKSAIKDGELPNSFYTYLTKSESPELFRALHAAAVKAGGDTPVAKHLDYVAKALEDKAAGRPTAESVAREWLATKEGRQWLAETGRVEEALRNLPKKEVAARAPTEQADTKTSQAEPEKTEAEPEKTEAGSEKTEAEGSSTTPPSTYTISKEKVMAGDKVVPSTYLIKDNQGNTVGKIEKHPELRKDGTESTTKYSWYMYYSDDAMKGPDGVNFEPDDVKRTLKDAEESMRYWGWNEIVNKKKPASPEAPTEEAPTVEVGSPKGETPTAEVEAPKGETPTAEVEAPKGEIASATSTPAEPPPEVKTSTEAKGRWASSEPSKPNYTAIKDKFKQLGYEPDRVLDAYIDILRDERLHKDLLNIFKIVTGGELKSIPLDKLVNLVKTDSSGASLRNVLRPKGSISMKRMWDSLTYTAKEAGSSSPSELATKAVYDSLQARLYKAAATELDAVEARLAQRAKERADQLEGGARTVSPPGMSEFGKEVNQFLGKGTGASEALLDIYTKAVVSDLFPIKKQEDMLINAIRYGSASHSAQRTAKTAIQEALLSQDPAKVKEAIRQAVSPVSLYGALHDSIGEVSKTSPPEVAARNAHLRQAQWDMVDEVRKGGDKGAEAASTPAVTTEPGAKDASPDPEKEILRITTRSPEDTYFQPPLPGPKDGNIDSPRSEEMFGPKLPKEDWASTINEYRKKAEANLAYSVPAAPAPEPMPRVTMTKEERKAAREAAKAAKEAEKAKNTPDYRVPDPPRSNRERFLWALDVLGIPRDVDFFDLERLFLSYFVGNKSLNRSTTMGQLPHGMDLEKFLIHYGAQLHVADRPKLVDAVKAIYDRLLYLYEEEIPTRSEFKGITFTKPDNLKKGLETLNALYKRTPESTKFWTLMGKREGRTRIAPRERMVDSAAQYAGALLDQITRVEGKLREAQFNGNPIDFIHTLVSAFGENPTVSSKMWEKLFYSLDALNNTRGPFRYSLEWARRTGDITSLAKEVAAHAQDTLGSIHRTLTHAPGHDGLQLLYSLGPSIMERITDAFSKVPISTPLAEEASDLQGMLNRAADPSALAHPGDADAVSAWLERTAKAQKDEAKRAKSGPDGKPAEAAPEGAAEEAVPTRADVAAFARRELLAEVERRVQDGRMTNKRAAQVVRDYLSTVPDEEMAKMSAAMAYLGRQRSEMMLHAAMEKQVVEKLEGLLSGITESVRSVRKNTILPGEEEWARHRAVLDPKALYVWYRHNMAGPIDAIMKSVFRYHGVDHNIIDRTEQWEEQLAMAQSQARRYIRQELIHTDMPQLLHEHGVRMDRTNYGEVLRNVDEGWFHMEAYKGGLAYTSENAEHTAAVRARAQMRYNEGLAMMKKVFGNDTARIEAFNAAFAKLLDEKYTWPLFQAERNFGLPISYREDYIPLAMRGTWSDINELIDGPIAKEKRTSVASTHLSAAERRNFRNAAELEVFLERENGRRGSALSPKLPVEVNRSIVSTMVQRRFLHNKAITNAQFLYDLKGMLPNGVLPFKRGRSRGNIEAEGYKDMGDIMPQMSGWAVTPEVHTYLSTYTKGGMPTGSTLEHFGNAVTRAILPMARLLKHWNVSLDLIHIKNIATLGLIGGVDMVEAARMVKDAMRAARERGLYDKRMAAGWFERTASPVSPIADVLETHPLYDLALRSGLFPYGGMEVGLPLDHQVDVDMGRVPAWKQWFDGHSAPPNRLTFDVIDRAMRLTLFKQYLDLGMGAREAAKTANHYLLDYSIKWMNPATRAWGYSLFPFFGWTVGNLKLHAPNMMQNPRWYMFLGRINQYMNNEFSGIPDDALPASLASSFVTPWWTFQPKMQDTALTTSWPFNTPSMLRAVRGGYQMAITPQYPHSAVSTLMGRMVNAAGKGDVMGLIGAPVRFAGSRMWAPMRIATEAMFPGAADREANTPLSERLFGDRTRPGLVQQHFTWGIGGLLSPAYREILYPMLSGEAWSHGLPFPKETLANFLVRTQGMYPNTRMQE